MLTYLQAVPHVYHGPDVSDSTRLSTFYMHVSHYESRRALFYLVLPSGTAARYNWPVALVLNDAYALAILNLSSISSEPTMPDIVFSSPKAREAIQHKLEKRRIACYAIADVSQRISNEYNQLETLMFFLRYVPHVRFIYPNGIVLEMGTNLSNTTSASVRTCLKTMDYPIGSTNANSLNSCLASECGTAIEVTGYASFLGENRFKNRHSNDKANLAAKLAQMFNLNNAQTADLTEASFTTDIHIPHLTVDNGCATIIQILWNNIEQNMGWVTSAPATSTQNRMRVQPIDTSFKLRNNSFPQIWSETIVANQEISAWIEVTRNYVLDVGVEYRAEAELLAANFMFRPLAPLMFPQVAFDADNNVLVTSMFAPPYVELLDEGQTQVTAMINAMSIAQPQMHALTRQRTDPESMDYTWCGKGVKFMRNTTFVANNGEKAPVIVKAFKECYLLNREKGVSACLQISVQFYRELWSLQFTLGALAASALSLESVGSMQMTLPEFVNTEFSIKENRVYGR